MHQHMGRSKSWRNATQTRCHEVLRVQPPILIFSVTIHLISPTSCRRWYLLFFNFYLVLLICCSRFGPDLDSLSCMNKRCCFKSVVSSWVMTQCCHCSNCDDLSSFLNCAVLTLSHCSADRTQTRCCLGCERESWTLFLRFYQLNNN